MTLNQLRDEALRIAFAHGFTDATIGEDIALIHSEASEALEEYRSGATPPETRYTDTYDGIHFKPEGIPSEMADIIIRVLHFCGKHGIDIERIVNEKMAFNDTRPYKNGGKRL